MTTLEGVALREATDQYRRARREHDRMALIDSRENRPLMALKEAAAARHLARYAPSETLVVAEVIDPRDNGRNDR